MFLEGLAKRVAKLGAAPDRCPEAGATVGDMTPVEKVTVGLVLLWVLSHALLKWGTEAGLPASVLALAEWAVTT